MTDCNSVNIPMKAGWFIEMSEPGDYEEVNIKSHQRLIGKLMYLLCGTRPDIIFTVGQLSKHNLDPRSGYMKTVKKVVKYLKRTMRLGLVYGSSQNDVLAASSPFGLIKYGNSSYAGDLKDKKSVMGYYYFLNGAILSWCSKKQQIISTLIIEAEYMALGHVAHEFV